MFGKQREMLLNICVKFVETQKRNRWTFMKFEIKIKLTLKHNNRKMYEMHFSHYTHCNIGVLKIENE